MSKQLHGALSLGRDSRPCWVYSFFTHFFLTYGTIIDFGGIILKFPLLENTIAYSFYANFHKVININQLHAGYFKTNFWDTNVVLVKRIVQLVVHACNNISFYLFHLKVNHSVCMDYVQTDMSKRGDPGGWNFAF